MEGSTHERFQMYRSDCVHLCDFSESFWSPNGSIQTQEHEYLKGTGLKTPGSRPDTEILARGKWNFSKVKPLIENRASTGFLDGVESPKSWSVLPETA